MADRFPGVLELSVFSTSVLHLSPNVIGLRGETIRVEKLSAQLSALESPGRQFLMASKFFH